MKKGKILLITPNLKGIGDGVNRIQPSLGLMLIAQVLKDDGHVVKIHDPALDGWNNRKTLDPVNNVVLIGQSDEEIAKAISKVLSNENEINNRQSVLHLDENIITSKVIEIYHKAIKENLRNTKTNQGNNGV